MSDVVDSFGPNAAKYATSGVHANPTELRRLVELAAPHPTDRVLDVATGAGHLAFAFAPRVDEVVALDVTMPMLEEVRKGAELRRLENVKLLRSDAHSIAAPDESFDIVACRLAAHHFAMFPEFLREAHRVLKPRGTFLLADTASPEDETLDREINEIEVLRDPSHVRNRRYSEYRAELEAAGFEITYEDRDPVGFAESEHGMDVETWMDRIGTAPDRREAVRALLGAASPALAEALRLSRPKGRLHMFLPRITLRATKA